MGGLSPWHWLIVLAVVLLLFGSKKLPEMARGLGRSARIFKSEIKEMQNDDNAGEQPQDTRALTEGGPSNTAQFTQPQAHPAQHQPVSQGYPQASQQTPQQGTGPSGQTGHQQPHGGQ